MGTDGPTFLTPGVQGEAEPTQLGLHGMDAFPCAARDQQPTCRLVHPIAQVLWLHDCLAIWRSVHFLGHIAMLAIILLGNVVPPRRMRRELQPEQAGARAAAAEAASVKKQAAAAFAAGDGVATAAVAAGGQQEKKEL